MRPIFLALVALAGCVTQTGGDSRSSDPDWHERTVAALVNSVRLSPTGWGAWAKATLGPNVLAAYPAVAPLTWNTSLGASSRAHATDMSTNGCYQYSSCDGTKWDSRVASYYNLSTNLGEAIAATIADPLAVVEAWVCDAQADGTCCPDDPNNFQNPCDGDRHNLMRSEYQTCGAGWANVAGERPYWTIDFGGTSSTAAAPLVDGSHLLVSTVAGQPPDVVRFFVNVDAGAAPASVTLALGDQLLPMQVALGTAASGTWQVEVPAATDCRAYDFLLQDAGGVTWRYPGKGQLLTYGEGKCSSDFQE